jgi:hypothetical protein
MGVFSNGSGLFESIVRNEAIWKQSPMEQQVGETLASVGIEV